MIVVFFLEYNPHSRTGETIVNFFNKMQIETLEYNLTTIAHLYNNLNQHIFFINLLLFPLLFIIALYWKVKLFQDCDLIF